MSTDYSRADNMDASPVPDSDKYRTRRGMRTAREAAEECIQSAAQSLIYLQENFELLGSLSQEAKFSDIAMSGLSSIVDAIAYDVKEARNYYLGDDDEPAKA